MNISQDIESNVIYGYLSDLGVRLSKTALKSVILAPEVKSWP